MPTAPGATSEPLSPQQTLDKVAGLLTEIEDPGTQVSDATPEPDIEPAAPEAPLQTSGTTPTPEDDENHELTIDGEPVVVPLKELKKSYSREANYTRKSEALAAERRAFETESAGIAQQRQQYQDGLRQLTQALEKIQGEPDWVKLRSEVPADEFLKQKADWEASKAHLDRLKAHEAQVRDESQRAEAKEFQKRIQAEQDKLRQAVPEWQNPEVQRAETQKLVGAAKAYGFTEQEVLSVVDHRALLILRDAMRYRELHREPATPKRTPIKAAKPGTPERPRPNEKQQKLIEQTRSGRSMDAMRAIEAMLPD